MTIGVGRDGNMLNKIEAGKKRGKGYILGVTWIVDVSIKIAS